MAAGYLVLKWIHVVSAMALVGVGLGTAFHFWYTCRGADIRAIAASARATVAADFIFTLPAAFLQPASGFALAMMAGYPLGSTWIVGATALYLLAGACWIPVVVIQLRLRDIAARHAADGSSPGSDFRRLYRLWFALGWPALFAMAATLWLMIARPS